MCVCVCSLIVMYEYSVWLTKQIQMHMQSLWIMTGSFQFFFFSSFFLYSFLRYLWLAGNIRNNESRHFYGPFSISLTHTHISLFLGVSHRYSDWTYPLSCHKQSHKMLSKQNRLSSNRYGQCVIYVNTIDSIHVHIRTHITHI